MATAKKIETVEKLTQKLAKAKSVVLADYRGLKHKQMEELRKTLKKVNADFVVAKNRLFLRALGDKAETLNEFLNDTTAALFAYADEVAPLAHLVKFFKNAGVGKLKAGLMGSQTLVEADLTRLSTLPSRDVLLAQLVGQLRWPLQGLHYALGWNVRKFVYAIEAIKNSKS